jgi:hypothetical protein
MQVDDLAKSMQGKCNCLNKEKNSSSNNNNNNKYL